MNFKDCIRGHIASGKVTQAQGEDLLKRYDGLVNKYAKSGKLSESAALAAQEILGRERMMSEARRRNLQAAAVKQQEVNADYETKLEAEKAKVPKKDQEKVEAKFAPKYASDLYQRAAYRAEAVKRTVYGFMDQIADTMKADFFEMGRDYKTFSDGVRALLGGEVSDPKARQIAEVLKQTFDYMNERFRQAGGIIGKIENYYPQIHMKESIRKVSKEVWTNFLFDRLDIEKMIDDSTGLPFTPEKLRAIIEDDYENIKTGGRHDLKQMSKKGEMPKGRAMDLDMRQSKSRFYQFKSADAFLEYNSKFGAGEQGLVEAYLGRIESMSRDIATMELMGPRPTALSRFLDHKMGVAGTSALKRNWVNAEYRVLASKFSPSDAESTWWRALTGTQNLLRSIMLGGASISAISDTAFIAATAKINGLDAARALGNYAKILAPGDREAKQIARRSGFITEAIQGSVLADTRFAGEALGGGFTRHLAGLTNKFSGLARMTKATQDAIALEGMATIAETLSAGKAWKDLPDDLRVGLERFGIDDLDWADLAKAPIVDNGSAKFLITSELRVSEQFDAVRAAELSNKLDDWIFYLRQTAANEPLLATKAMTTAGQGAGHLARAGTSSLLMFKSFPVTVLLSHTLPALQRAGLTPGTIRKPFNQRKYDHLATVLIATTILGAGAMQLKEITKGRTPKEVDDVRFWAAAFLQGGGLGLFGDFFLGDYSRFDRSPVTELAGPIPALFEDIWQATKGNLDKFASGEDPKNPWRDVFNVAKRNIPLGSLWYGRLAVERLILDNLERMIDPGFDQRMRRFERRLSKKGQKFLWAPGEIAPDPTVVLGD